MLWAEKIGTEKFYKGLDFIFSIIKYIIRITHYMEHFQHIPQHTITQTQNYKIKKKKQQQKKDKTFFKKRKLTIGAFIFLF